MKKLYTILMMLCIASVSALAQTGLAGTISVANATANQGTYYVHDNFYDTSCDILNSGTADFNGQLVVGVGLFNVNADSYSTLKLAPAPLSVKAGEMATVKVKVTDIPETTDDPSTYHYISIGYLPEGKQLTEDNVTWDEVAFFGMIKVKYTSTGMTALQNSNAGSAPVYNLQGVKVGHARQLSTLPSGVYIVNGKKIVR